MRPQRPNSPPGDLVMCKQLLNSVFAACLAGGLLLSSLPVGAVLPSEVSAGLELSHNLSEAWRAVVASEPGIYRRGEWVFSYASATLHEGETLEHLKDRAQAEAIRQLVADYADRHYNGDSITVQITREYMKTHVHMTFNGRVLQSDCDGKICRNVFCASATALDQAPTVSQKLSAQQQAHDAFVKNPADYPDILQSLGAFELALLSEVRVMPQAYANVFLPLVPSRSQIMRMSSFLNERSEILNKLAKDAPSAQAKAAVAQAGEKAEAFDAFLQASSVKPVHWHPKRPILAQAAAAQGFVVIDERADNKTPAVMAVVKEKFSQGVDLPLVTQLLEAAVEAAPRNAEAWEYLAAAYYAADRLDQARICARVWFILSDSPAAPLKYLLTKFQTEEQARRLAAIL